MRSLVSLAVALAVTLPVATAGLAQGPASPSDKPAAASKAIRNVSGTVRSVAPETLVVEGRDKGKDVQWTFAVDPSTNIRKGGKSITTGDLKPGDAVQVRYVERDGKAMAEAILVSAPRKNVREANPK